MQKRNLHTLHPLLLLMMSQHALVRGIAPTFILFAGAGVQVRAGGTLGLLGCVGAVRVIAEGSTVGAFAIGTFGVGVNLVSSAEQGVVLHIGEQLLLHHEVTPFVEVLYGGSIFKVRLHVSVEAFVEAVGEQGLQLCLREMFTGN